MKTRKRVWAGMGPAIAVIGGTLALGSVPEALADGIVPKHQLVRGNSYGDWSAQWWQWILSIPEATNPNLDTTGQFCGEGQAGPVWFLGGSFGNDPVDRTCTVPAGKLLFFPIVTSLFGSGVFDCDPTVPNVLCNLAELRQSADAALADVSLQLVIDGAAVPVRTLHRQRVTSPVLTLTYPEDNVVGEPAGTYSPQVADGYWVMLRALPPGDHTLDFRGEFLSGPFQGTVVDVGYALTVTP